MSDSHKQLHMFQNKQIQTWDVIFCHYKMLNTCIIGYKWNILKKIQLNNRIIAFIILNVYDNYSGTNFSKLAIW